MSNNTLLAALTLRLHSHPENIATEALLHILQTHQSAAEALESLLHHAGLPDLGPLFFQTQVHGEKDSIPDLVGANSVGEELLVIEAKFWAHLTDKQPTDYLTRLPESKPAVLLFVCPEARRTLLWDQIAYRTRAAGYQIVNGTHSHMITWTLVKINAFLAIASWRAILGSLAADAAAHNDQDYLADVNQLHGLCDRMDTEAFLPLRPAELSQEIGRRVSQFADLIDDSVGALAKNVSISTKGLSTGGSHASYGRFFKFKDRIGCFLHYSPRLWSSPGVSPIWLEIQHVLSESKWTTPSALKTAMRRYCIEQPTRMTDSDGTSHIAILLECGVEKKEVVDNIVLQVLEILNAVDADF